MNAARLHPDPANDERPADTVRIFVLLPTLNPYGGVISVVNMTNVLVDRGNAITLGSLSRVGTDLLYPRTEPVFVDDANRLADVVPEHFDVVVATSWQTVEPIRDLAKSLDALPLYFVQDFEPDFYSDTPRKQAARATYDAIPNRIVKTRYLQERLMSEGGWSAQKIRPGMNLDIFYPRRATTGTATGRSILAMGRPTTSADHRGFRILVDVYEQLHTVRPDVNLQVFGPAEAGDFNPPVQTFGRVAPSQLPLLYSSASVFVDTSRRHGFGRTGVEAMACGTPVVLSDSGGISDYAIHEANALVVPVGDVPATVSAIRRLLDDKAHADRLSAAGLATAASMSDYGAADDFMRVVKELS